MDAPTFKRIDAQDVSVVAQLFAQHGNRKITAVHLHHTYIPNRALFDSLTLSMDSAEAAGQELCARMWRYHTQELQWSDIGQHVTIDPSGAIWLNRAWDKPPASSKGSNGSFDLGPFMIELVGDFDVGRETPTAPQHAAMIATIVAIQSAFDLRAEELFFHNELSSSKSCPGSSFDKPALIEELSAASSKSSAKAGSRSRVSRNGGMHAAEHQLLLQSVVLDNTGARGVGYSDAEYLAEPEEDDMSIETIASLSDSRFGLSSVDSRGGAETPELTPFMMSELKSHVINIRQGRLSNSGDFTTTKADLDRLIDQDLSNWAVRQIAQGEIPRVMIHAHGGLNNEQTGLLYAYKMHKWWLDQGIYPIYFVWETGIVESFMQMLEEYNRAGERGFIDDLKDAASEVRDTAVEQVVRAIGRDFWTIMKIAASRASDTASDAGAHYLATRLEALYKDHNKSIEFNAVGHSAGAILLAYFMRECNEGTRKIPFQTLSLLAPACTVDLFDHYIRPRIDGTKIKHLSIFNLDRQTERSDPTVPIYGKSLLHLVSDGFETKRNTPILGMDKFVKDDEDLTAFLGLGSQPASLVSYSLSPNKAHSTPRLHSESTTHGGFALDYATMRAIALRIRNLNDLKDVNDVPPFKLSDTRAGVDSRLFAPLRDRLDSEVYGAFFNRRSGSMQSGISAPIASTNNASSVFASGKRVALCIGINKYRHGMALSGCVNDALAWEKCFKDAKFNVQKLLDEEATYRSILDSIGSIVSSSKEGDIVAIQYAGHGIRFEDISGDELDHMDEALVPIDNNRELFVSDDELWEVLQSGHKGAHIYVFMDCCHSMSNTRAMPAMGMTPRYITPDKQMTLNHAKRLRGRGVRSTPKSIESMRHIKYAACNDNEYAYESDGHGKFTVAATAAIRQSSFACSNHEFLLNIESHFANDSRQHPGLECPTDIKHNPFLFL